MKISYKWLKDFVNVEGSPEELAGLLTNTGLEVESLGRFETIRGGLTGVITGHVLECEKHPEADRLSITKVDIGTGILDIVCGAPNVKAGQKVLVATVGTILPAKEGDFEIRKAKIRGQVSHGMICAEDELGIGSSHEGIMVLPEKTPVGLSASEFLNLYEDWVIEIGLTPNRIDAASHIGVARDLAAALNHQSGERKYKVQLPDVSDFEPDNHDLVIPVIIEDKDACHRYCGLTISGVKVQESPQWLKNRLTAIGQKPINNVVDVTNYVLHELGHPLHAFDVAFIEGGQIVVRKAVAGTKFVTLDKSEINLTGNDLMICNSLEPMCMAGILGGLNSGVTESTANVFLECAWFSPVTVRRSSNYHDIRTDSSFRFERGADPGMALVAIKRAAMIIKQVAGGKISSDVMDVFPVKTKQVELRFNYHTADRLIGNKIPREEIIGILTDLDFVIQKKGEDFIEILVPAYRVDVTREADVVEELLRIYGYNNVVLPEKLHSSLVLSPKPDKEKQQNVIADMLAAQGFYEIMNNSLTKAYYYGAHGFSPEKLVEILNPISQDLNVMRKSLLFGGLESIVYNLNRKVRSMKFFEFGSVYSRNGEDIKEDTPVKGYTENVDLALLMTGRIQPETWSVDEKEMNFFNLQNAVNNILKRLGFSLRSLQPVNHAKTDLFVFSQSLFVAEKEIAILGLLSNGVTGQFDIKQQVYAGFINWQELLNHAGSEPLLYREISRYPEVRRDLALLVDKMVTFSEIERIAFEAERNNLSDVRLFDVYQDEKLGKDKKSYAVCFILQDEKKTLTDKEIDGIMERLTQKFIKQLGASIR